MIKEKYTIKDFIPLIVIFTIILAFSIVAPMIWGGGIMHSMRDFMGGFFVIFGLLKIMKLKSFADAYQMYDVVAVRSKAYAYAYPFIELTLGIFFFINFKPLLTNWITLILMLVSALGVYLKLRKREKIMCACLGTVFKVPMTWVTLFEDLLMTVMALVMIVSLQGGMANTDFTQLSNSTQEVQAMQVIELTDGDTFDLEASIVKQQVGNRTIKRLAYNGQIPGPVIKVQKGATITVNLKNSIDVDTTLHSHGLRLDNAFDGVPDVTQAPIKPGETFSYTLTFPDEGVYWYHPHIREDYTQELGLYGNFIVDGDDNYWNQVNQEEYLIFDDFLEDGEFDSEKVTHTLMGRFGDTLLINDQKDFKITVEQGQINRFFLTNVANTRVFDLEFEGTEIKHVGGDVGRIQKEELINDVIIAPAERYIIETMYSKTGTYEISHRGEKIGEIIVTQTGKGSAISFNQLRNNSDDYSVVLGDLDSLLAKTSDKSLRLNIEMKGAMQNMMGGTIDHSSMMMDSSEDQAMIEHCKMMPKMSGCEPYLETETMEEHSNDGIEWEDEMAIMNQMSNDQNLEWQIIDDETGKTNMDIDWSFNQGDLIKISIFNDPNSMHPMQHPIHFHGQRFVVLTRDGVTNDNLQWKDTTLITTGETVDILVEMSNLGTWMTHCHIAEHLHAGMMFGFSVVDATDDSSAPISLQDLTSEYEIQGTEHVTPGESHNTYNSNPPSSGWHYAQAPDWAIYKKPILDESALHAVEHGGIWISYKDISTEQKEELELIQKDNKKAVIMSPRNENDASIAIVSWGKVMKLEDVKTGLIQKFIDVNKNNTHEPFAG